MSEITEAKCMKSPIRKHKVFVRWKPEYNLGIPLIDEQHRGFVAMLNSLYYGIQNGHVKNMIDPIINMIDEYSSIHFKMEEELIERCFFPGAKAHSELHKQLRNKLVDIKRKTSFEKEPYRLMELLKKWWTHHICVEDLQFRNYLLESSDW